LLLHHFEQFLKDQNQLNISIHLLKEGYFQVSNLDKLHFIDAKIRLQVLLGLHRIILALPEIISGIVVE